MKQISKINMLVRATGRLFWIVSGFTFALVLCVQVCALTSWSQAIDRNVFHPIVFGLRAMIQKPQLDQRIKIFTFDDKTALKLTAFDLSLADWGRTLSALVAKPGTRLIIDKLFDAPYSTAEIHAFQDQMRANSDSFVSLISFFGPKTIVHPIIPTDQMERMSSALISRDVANLFPKGADPNIHAYGASSEILGKFNAFGFANYSGGGHIAPFVRLSDGGIMSHAALTMATKLSVTGTKLLVNGRRMPVSGDGRLLINFFEKSTYYEQAYSLGPVVELARKSKDISIVNPGDIVVVLPAMFTGNTDFIETPYGAMPGGFHIVALVNSILTGNWLAEWSDPGFFSIIFGFFGFLVSLIVKPVRAMVFNATAIAFTIVASVALFVYGNISFSFVLPVVSLGIGAFGGILIQGHAHGIEEARIAREIYIAALVQRSFFPVAQQGTALNTTTKVVGRHRSASECGGDWWTSLSHNGFTYVMVADAVGHGLPSAFVTAMAFAAVRSIEIDLKRTNTVLKPSEWIKEINEVMMSLALSLTQMTFLVVRIDDATGSCLVANAGNQQPFLMRKSPAVSEGASISSVSACGDIIGAFADVGYEDKQVELRTGDMLVLFTDGIIENIRTPKDTPVRRNWMRAKLRSLQGESLEIVSRDLWKEYNAALGKRPREDDATLVVVQFLGA